MHFYWGIEDLFCIFFGEGGGVGLEVDGMFLVLGLVLGKGGCQV